MSAPRAGADRSSRRWRPQCLLPGGGIARATGQQRQPPLQAGEDGLRWEESDARRGQLDGERQAVQSTADLGHRRGILVVEGEFGLDGVGALDEEAHGGILGELLDWEAACGRLASGGTAYSRSARRWSASRLETSTFRPRGQPEISSDRGRSGHDVLEVVQHQQQPLARHVSPRGSRPDGVTAIFPHAQRAAIARGRGRDRSAPPAARRRPRPRRHRAPRPRPASQTGLAGAAGSGQRQQAASSLRSRPTSSASSRSRPMKGVGWTRQIVRPVSRV